MDNSITFTPAELMGLIIGVATAIITISTACGVIINVIKKTREPEKKQDERIANCEARLDKMDAVIEKFQGFFSNDDRRFREIEEGNKKTQKALLALLKYSLNGNDKSALIEAERSLEEYLINK